MVTYRRIEIYNRPKMVGRFYQVGGFEYGPFEHYQAAQDDIDQRWPQLVRALGEAAGKVVRRIDWNSPEYRFVIK